MKKMIVALALVLCASVFGGCSTSSNVVVASAKPVHITGGKAYLVTHGDKSADVDKALEGALKRHNLEVVNVKASPSAGTPGIYVTYNDAWNWDITMYLKAINIQFFDAKTNALLATGDWNNSALHGFHSLDGVVGKTVDDMFTKLAAGR